MKNLIMLEVGTCRSIILETTMNASELEELYRKGTNFIGFDFVSEIDFGYREDSLTADQYKVLEERLILDIDDFYFFDSENPEFYLDIAAYVKAFLGICKLGTGLREHFDVTVRDIQYLAV